MKRNDIFTFTAPNGVEVTGVVVDTIARWLDFNALSTTVHLCYAQNRLFTWKEEFKQGELINSHYGRVAVDYAVLPDYDSMLKSYLSKKSCEEEVDTLIEKELYL